MPLARAWLLSVIVGALPWGCKLALAAPEAVGDPDYFTIEGMRSQQFSVGIFIFLLIGILVFTGIVISFMRLGKSNRLKTGEKIMFAWLFFGIIVAVVMAAVQLLGGHLL